MHQIGKCILVSLIGSSGFGQQPLHIVSWNVESDGNDPAVIAGELTELGSFDIFALQEVRPENIGRYGDAIRRKYGKGYRYFASSTGRSDRLMIAFDSNRLRLLEIRELFYFGTERLNDFRHRSPLVCEFECLPTNTRFFFLTVHLARGDEELRQEQARGLREWARAKRAPVIASGDFNLDFDFNTKRGNKAFVEMQMVWRVEVDSARDVH